MKAKYEVRKDTMNVPCEHEKCEQLHQRFMNEIDINTGEWFHMTTRTEWIVVDTQTENCEYLGLNKKDCVAYANRENAKVGA